ncbi:hypothetical protein CEXT_407071 [Caerostris extrusa]|uniref:Uncharacterized protein n=1 Tax=Caerostris extrusa TaxID=172846 RepID=A0AAV4XGR6_CAEEX|nr:hypothetical protein CEXT_407071 [Caerostris extrusa]
MDKHLNSYRDTNLPSNLSNFLVVPYTTSTLASKTIHHTMRNQSNPIHVPNGHSIPEGGHPTLSISRFAKRYLSMAESKARAACTMLCNLAEGEFTLALAHTPTVTSH